MTFLNNTANKFLFLALEGTDPVKSRNLLNALKNQGVDCELRFINSSHKIKTIYGMRKIQKSGLTIVVCSNPNNSLAIYACILLRFKVILDAGWPMFDSAISSRNENGNLYLKRIKIMLIDFLSMNLSSIVILESEEQVRWCSRFVLKRSKLKVLPCGLNESRFKRVNYMGIKNKYIIFRGNNVPESGLNIISEAMRILKELNFIVVSRNTSSLFGDLPNVLLYDCYLDDDQISTLYGLSRIAIGQVSDHPRVQKTIPMKFFEAMYLGIPYLSANSTALKDFELRGALAFTQKGSVSDLVLKLSDLYQDETRLLNLSEKALELYSSEFSPKSLCERFLKIVSA